MNEVLFFGDSLTWGMAHSYTGRYEDSYPQMLEARLAARGYVMVESALCSRTTSQDDAKFDWLVGGEAHFFNGMAHFMPEFLAHQCRVLVLLLGTNDLKPAIRNQTKVPVRAYAQHVANSCANIALRAKAAHNALRAEHQLDICIVCPPTVKLCQHSIELGFDDQSVKLSQELPKAYREMCQANGFHFVMVEGIDMDKSVDGVHVTLEDTRKIAEAVWTQALDALLPQQDTPVGLAPPSLLLNGSDDSEEESDDPLRNMSWIECLECHKWRMHEYGLRPQVRRWTCRNSFWHQRFKEWKTGCGWNEDEHIVLHNKFPGAINTVVEAPPAPIPPPPPVQPLQDTRPAAAAAAAVPNPSRPSYLAPTAPLRPNVVAAAPMPMPLASTPTLPTAKRTTALPSNYSQQQQQAPMQNNAAAPPPPTAAAWSTEERIAFRQFVDRLSGISTPAFLEVWISDVNTVLNEFAPPMSQYHAFQNMKQMFAQYPQVVHDLDELVMSHPNIGVCPALAITGPNAAAVQAQPMMWNPQQQQQQYGYGFSPQQQQQQQQQHMMGPAGYHYTSAAAAAPPPSGYTFAANGSGAYGQLNQYSQQQQQAYGLMMHQQQGYASNPPPSSSKQVSSSSSALGGNRPRSSSGSMFPQRQQQQQPPAFANSSMSYVSPPVSQPQQYAAYSQFPPMQQQQPGGYAPAYGNMLPQQPPPGAGAPYGQSPKYYNQRF